MPDYTKTRATKEEHDAFSGVMTILALISVFTISFMALVLIVSIVCR